MRRVLLTIGLLGGAAFVPGATLAQPEVLVAPGTAAKATVNRSSHNVDVMKGTQVVFRLDQPFSSISVGDPDVADILPKSDRVFVLVGKKAGSTDFVVFFDSMDTYRSTVSVRSATGVANDRPENRVVVHNKRLLSNYNSFYCSETWCGPVEDPLGGPAQQAPVEQIITTIGGSPPNAPAIPSIPAGR